MRFRLFPSDVEGTGCYRVLFPYGFMANERGWDAFCEIDPGFSGKGTIPWNFPFPKGPLPPHFGDADVFVFQRRFEKIMPQLIYWLKSHGKRVVVEVDDLYHELPKNAPAIRAFKKLAERQSADALLGQVAAADVLTCSTPRLAELYGAEHPNVHVLPNVLNWDIWKDIEPVYQRERDKVRIGWMGWLKWRGDDLKVLRGKLGAWLDKRPNVEFVSVGDTSDQVLRYLGVSSRRGRFLPGASFPGHAVPLQEIDIGLVPLAPNEFNECKSYLKGLEYAACGIPCIASPTGPYREWVDGANGLLANTADEWLDALDSMLEGDEWREMGEEARAKAVCNTIQEHWPRWEAVLAGPEDSHDRDVRPASSGAPATA